MTDKELIQELHDKAEVEGAGSTRRLLELAARALEQRQWVSVKGAMPRMCEPVILTGCNRFGNHFPAQIGYYDGVGWTVFGQPMDLEKIGVTVTHWMPRPEPPEVEEDD